MHRRLLDGSGWTKKLSLWSQLVFLCNDGISQLLPDGQAEDFLGRGTWEKLPTDSVLSTHDCCYANRYVNALNIK